MKEIGQETFRVGFGDIDPSDRLTIGAAFDYFQEAAIQHAEELGVGRESMARTGTVWILSRMSVVIERRPRYDELITVRSWPRGWEKLFAVRDYDILDETGKAVVRGRSGWLIVDIEKRRPLRPQAVVETLPKNEGLDALPAGIVSLDTRENLTLAGDRTSRYSDIDFNGHVNNVRYIQWIQDVTAPTVLEKADTLRLDINYISETRLGETTGIWTSNIEGGGANMAGYAAGYAYEGRRRDAQATTAFRAELRFASSGSLNRPNPSSQTEGEPC
jgi:acyl-ACP thioesterase